MDGRQSGHRELAGIGSGKSSVHVAFRVKACAYGNEIGSDIEHICDHLRSRGFMTLALRAGTDRNYHCPGNIKFAVRALGVDRKRSAGIHDLGLAKIVSSGIERGANAVPDHTPLLAGFSLFLSPGIPADQTLREFQHSWVIARIINATIRRRIRELFGTDVVPQSHLVSRDSQFVGANVDGALQEPEMLHARIATIGAYGTFIRDRLAEIDAGILETVNTREYLGPDHASEWLVAGIGAAIVDVAGRDRGDHAVLVECDPRVAGSALVAVGARGHWLGTRLDPLNRTAAPFSGGEGAYRHLRLAGDLEAKPAADIEGLDANAVDVNVEVRSQKLDSEGRKRIVAPVVDAVVLVIPLGDDDIVFERRAREPVEVHAVDFDHRYRFPKRLLDVAVLEHSVPYLIRAGFFMQDAGIAESLLGIDDGIEGIVIDLHSFGRVISNCGGLSDNGNHWFALVADLRHCEGIIANLAACVRRDFDKRLSLRSDLRAG